jgi:hypothetical protein
VESELDVFLTTWEAQHAPAHYDVPGDPGEYRTLGMAALVAFLPAETTPSRR